MRTGEKYRQALATRAEWEPYLLAECGLPGPRANLELAQTVVELGSRALFDDYLGYGPDRTPPATAYEFLPLCGIIGLGRLAAEGDHALLARIRSYAGDPRWRVREGVCLGLQRVGDADMDLLLAELKGWLPGSLLEQRAVAATLCEPRLLRAEAHARQVLALLDTITTSLTGAADRRHQDFKTLRQGLAYCWSVAVAACSPAGKPLMEKWLVVPDNDIRWIMKQNLGKARLQRMDPAWVAEQQARL